MKISLGTFAQSFKQSEFIKLIFKNQIGCVYSIRLPFGKFIALTFKKGV
jgi:hypothetical protein